MANDLQSFKRNLSAMIERQDLALPSTVRPEVFRNAAIVAFQTNPSIRKATPESVFTSLRHIAASGLMPDGREAAIVVYGDKAQPMPMVTGLRKIARNSGQIVAMWDDVVYEGEAIIAEFVDGVRVLKHTNKDGSPLSMMERGGEVIGAYAAAKLKDGTVEMEPMTKAEIEKRRMASPNQKGPKPAHVWGDWYNEMARKTAVRALCKRLPMSPEDYARIEADPTFREVEEPRDITPKETTEERLRRLQAEKAPEPQKEEEPVSVASDEPIEGEILDGDTVDLPPYDEGAVFPGEKVFNEGLQAHKSGKGSEENPHKENPDYSNWLGGWLQGKQFAEKGVK